MMYLALLLVITGTEAAPSHVSVSASFVPGKAGTPPSVAVTLTPQEAEVRVNEDPSPRLKLDPAQTVLVDKQPAPARAGTFDPATARYLDPALPVHFPVAVRAGAPKGRHAVRARVTYFYCSKREGWCRKGTSDVEFPVELR